MQPPGLRLTLSCAKRLHHGVGKFGDSFFGALGPCRPYRFMSACPAMPPRTTTRSARRLLLAALLALVISGAHAARQALVIGNSAYVDSPLKNPVNDARAMDAKLRALNFNVLKVEDLRRDDIGKTLRAFASRLQPGDEVVVFYAGHGVQVKGVNYLPAVDARIVSEDDVPYNSLSLSQLLDRLDEAKVGVKLLFLDACRNNPYARSFRSASRGLARVTDAPSGTLMHFATRPGSVAADGAGANGLYTAELLKHIDSPGLPVELMLKDVAAAVEQASAGQQEPWLEGSIKGSFFFKRALGGAPGTAANVVPERTDPGLNLDDLEREEANRREWAAWQLRMKQAFNKAAAFSGSPDLRAKAWERFLEQWAQDNPLSREDESLRAQAQQSLSTAREEMQRASQPPTPVPRLAQPVGDGEIVVRLGHVAPTSGAIAHLGKDNELGARMAVDDLNGKGVVIGRRRARFELVAEDDAGNPRTAAQVASKLIDAGVRAVIGHLNSGTSIPASRLYAQAGIPQVSPSATNPAYTRQGFNTTFRVVADDTALGARLGRYAVRSLGAGSLAVVDDRSAYGRGVADSFEAGAKAEGGRVLAREFTRDTATDFTALAASLAARQPDAIFFGGIDATAGPLLRQLRLAGWRGRFLGGDGICSAELVSLAGSAAVDGGVLCAEAGGADNANAALFEGFKARFKARYGVDVQLYAPYTYDAVMVVVAAMVRAGSSDPADYLPALAATRAYAGVTGPISFDAKGDLQGGALTLYAYRSGRRVVETVIR